MAAASSDRRVTKPATGESLEHLAKTVRSYRKARGLTQRQLAAAAGVTPGLISHIETGRTAPSTSTLLEVVRALNLPLDQLFADGPTDSATSERTLADIDYRAGASPIRVVTDRRVVQDEGRHTIRLESGVTWQLLTRTVDPRLRFMLVTYPPGCASSEADHLLRHDDHEYFYIITGVLRVQLAFEEMTLHAGDALDFDSAIPHRFENPGDTPCIGVWAILPQGLPAPDLTALLDKKGNAQ